MSMRDMICSITETLVIALFLATTGTIGIACAQGQAPVQPWGLPPLPAGIGPVEKFADVSNTPQGQFLEGGSFDTQGNLWFVAIGSGWVSYLTPEGKLVPAFNCNPPAELGQTCEPQGTRWYNGKLYLASRHRGILVYDRRRKRSKHSSTSIGTSSSKVPMTLTSMPKEICSLPIRGQPAQDPARPIAPARFISTRAMGCCVG